MSESRRSKPKAGIPRRTGQKAIARGGEGDLAVVRTRVANKWNPDDCPPGYDPVIWDLVLFFEQVGEEYKQASQGRPVIYSMLEKRIRSTGIDKGPLDILEDRMPSDQPWVRLMKHMIHYYWGFEMNPKNPGREVDEFTKLDEFTGLRDMIIGNFQREEAHKEFQERKARGEFDEDED
jgi:hypothetical protein